MLLTIIVFLITLSTLVLVHELGHFFAAKRGGIKVEEFGFGYPPRIFGKKIGETVYSVNWVLFGGFVRLYGEELRESKRVPIRDRGSSARRVGIREQENKRAFWAKSKKVRTGVILAGVLANFLLGIFLFSVVYSVSGIPVETDRIRVIGLALGSPAEKIGIKEGDVVLAVDGEEIKELEQFVELINQKSGQRIQLMVFREKDNPCLQKVLGGGPPEFSCQNGNLIFFLAPRQEPPEGEGPLGVLVSNIEMKEYPFWQMPFRGAVEGLKEAFGWTRLILDGLGKMLVGLIAEGTVPKDIAGPVGIFQVTGAVAQAGILNIFRFVGILSVNLAIINILPFPALDGGKMIFITYEVITRRRPKPKLEHWVNVAGMTFLLALIILVTINDIDRLVDLNAIWVRLKSSF